MINFVEIFLVGISAVIDILVVAVSVAGFGFFAGNGVGGVGAIEDVVGVGVEVGEGAGDGGSGVGGSGI